MIPTKVFFQVSKTSSFYLLFLYLILIEQIQTTHFNSFLFKCTLTHSPLDDVMLDLLKILRNGIHFTFDFNVPNVLAHSWLEAEQP